MIIHVPTRYDDLTPERINQALLQLGITGDAQIEYVNRDGRYIQFEHNGQHYFVCFAHDPHRGRNSFVMQYISKTYQDAVLQDLPKTRLAVYFPYSFEPSRPIARYHLFANRLLKTLHVELLNEREIFRGSISVPFTSVEELESTRQAHKSDTSNNNSSYIVSSENTVEIYGKLYGANEKETILFIATVAALTSQKVIFYPVIEHSTNTVPASAIALANSLKVELQEPIAQVVSRHEIAEEGRSTARRQSRFIYNLLEKYGPKKCAMCDCAISTAVIAAHIHRVTDINTSDLSEEEKIVQATDSDNGLWLCATHDKLFEYGAIYYTDDYLVACSDQLTNEQQLYVRTLTNVPELQAGYRSPAMAQYLALHRNRSYGSSN